MKVILMVLHLTNGEVAKVPITLLSYQTCHDKFIEMFQVSPSDDGVFHNGARIWTHYCKDGSGKETP